jgi:hypothetical protein
MVLLAVVIDGGTLILSWLHAFLKPVRRWVFVDGVVGAGRWGTLSLGFARIPSNLCDDGILPMMLLAGWW